MCMDQSYCESDKDYDDFIVQSRSIDHNIKNHESIKHAYDAWLKDKKIYIILFKEVNSHKYRRFRPKFKANLWSNLCEKKLISLSKKYEVADDNELFWIDQYMMPEEKYVAIYYQLKKRAKTEQELLQATDFYMSKCIKQVLTHEEFKQSYC